MRPSRKSDNDLFAASMRDVTPLKRRPRVVAKPAAVAAARPKAETPRIPAPLPPAPAPIANPGIDRATAQRLKRGRIALERRLDLHGMTEADAHAALDRFVRLAYDDGVRALLIVTGKGRLGQGALRKNTPRWLASGGNAAKVLSVAPAQIRHGGDGALYVLLRRKRT